jgi:hypothetical protein
MKKNVILMLAMRSNDHHLHQYEQYSLNTWKRYCEKHGIELFILRDALCDTEMMRPTWQRWYVYDILKANNIDYKQVALIDIDTMVHPDTPDIFKLSNNQYTGVIDDLSVEWIYNSVVGYKKFFPDVDLQWDKYINNGVLILPEDTGEQFAKMVTDFYNENQEELRNMQHRTLRKGSDQTPVNYMAKKFYGDKINYLSKKFNMTHLVASHAFDDNAYIKCSYIWHFNGFDRSLREGYMKRTWEMIKDKY